MNRESMTDAAVDEQLQSQLEQQLADGHLADAIETAKTLADASPADIRHRLNLGFLLIDARRYVEAYGIFSGLRAAKDEPLRWLGQGLTAEALGYFAEAAEYLENARRLAPELTVAGIHEVHCLVECRRVGEAQSVLSTLDFHADMPAEDAAELAACLRALNRFEEALQVADRALAHFPSDPRLLLIRVELLERAHRLDEADAELARVSEVEPAKRLLRARIMARRGQLEDAVNLLECLRTEGGATDLAGHLIAEVEFDLGRNLDHLGRYDDAWCAWTCGNRLDRERFIRQFPEEWKKSESNTAFVDRPRLDPFVRGATEGSGSEAIAPVFVVGFPRSGTTLLDVMLERHPSLQVIEEQPLIEPAMQALAAGPEGYPDAIAVVDNGLRDELRKSYWDEATRYGWRRDGGRLVDKNPFNLLRVHLIQTLFPDAKWLFMLRHPLDTLLSAYSQRLAFTGVTRGFWDIDEIAEIYRRSLTLWLAQSERLHLDRYELRYEVLVAKPQTEVRRVLEWLGLPWNSEMLMPQRTKSRQWTTTPSYAQVAQPLYGSSVGRWRAYSDRLESARRTLQPLIRRLRYDLD